MTESSIVIQSGQAVTDFMNKNRIFNPSHVNRQPTDLNFYEHHWPADRPGEVFLSHGKYSFSIPHTLGVMGRENVDRAADGIAEFNVYAGITADATMPYDEARKLFMNFMDKLLKKGWKPVITYEDPRLSGEEAFKYYEEVKYYTLPPDYTPTLDQWMGIDVGEWQLYADDVFLQMKLRRDRKRMTCKNPGAYFLSFTIETREELAKSYFEGNDRTVWKELWVDKVKTFKRVRYAKERELKERGFTIFTEYEEPMIHPQDPVEPD